MDKVQAQINRLQIKIKTAENKNNAGSGCVRKWKRQIRNLEKANKQ